MSRLYRQKDRTPTPRGRREQYATCSACGKQRILNADGTIRGHRLDLGEDGAGHYRLSVCEGSGRPAAARKVG